MQTFRYLLYLVFLAGCAILVGKARRPVATPLNIPSEVELVAEDLCGLPADGTASGLLDRVMAQLDPERVGWLETKLWQKVRLPGLSFTSEGRYLRGPDRRFRLDLQTTQFGGKGTMTGGVLLVSDGTNVWSGNRVGEGEWENVARLGLTEVVNTVEKTPRAREVRTEFFQGPTFSGITPLLRNVRWKLHWVRREELGGGRVQLTGCWPAGVQKILAPPEKPWPAGLPRRCRVVVRESALWVERIEWWGPEQRRGDDRLMVEMEFRDPVINQPLPPAVCAREFSFVPGSTVVTDVTGPMAADLAARARQLAAPK